MLEQGGIVPPRHGRAGSRGVEPKRTEGAGDSCGIRRVRQRSERCQVGGRTQFVECNPMDPRSSTRLAGVLAVRWPAVPPFHPNRASKQIDGVRSRA